MLWTWIVMGVALVALAGGRGVLLVTKRGKANRRVKRAVALGPVGCLVGREVGD